MHGESYVAILRELEEYYLASELTKSEHLPQYTEAEEELADVLIVCLTELHRRGTNVEEIVKAKIEFNKKRTMEKKFTEKDLVSFGNYVLSEKRNESIENDEARKVVGDWDIANWENYEQHD